MAWKRSSPEMGAFLAEAMAPFQCQGKKMFGYPCYFLNGNMFVGLHQDDLILRLSEEDRERLLSEWDEASQFEPMEGRPMKEYMVVPESLYNDPVTFREWLDRSYRYALSLPTKEPKKKG